MARYACDVTAVKNAGENLIKASDNMKKSLDNYSSKIESDLSVWESDSKNMFIATNADQVKNANFMKDYAMELGKFMKDAAEKIEELEKELATKDI